MTTVEDLLSKASVKIQITASAKTGMSLEVQALIFYFAPFRDGADA